MNTFRPVFVVAQADRLVSIVEPAKMHAFSQVAAAGRRHIALDFKVRGDLGSYGDNSPRFVTTKVMPTKPRCPESRKVTAPKRCPESPARSRRSNKTTVKQPTSRALDLPSATDLQSGDRSGLDQIPTRISE